MWSPLAPRAFVDAPLSHIATELKTRARATPDTGLLVGGAGRALFFLYYARFTGEPGDQSYAETQVGDLFESLPDPAPFSLCSGLAGAAWLLRHAGDTGLLDVDADALLTDIDTQVRERMLVEMREGRFDYLHGALGCASYLMEGNAPASRDAVAVVIGELERQALRDGDALSWRNPMVEDAISLGLSHGVPSVVSVLAQCMTREIDPARCARLLDGAVSFLGHHASADPENRSRYPALVGATDADDGPSRVAWCYGDPGVAAALWHAGRARSRSDWTTGAVATLERAAARRAPADTLVTDASLCHGSAGLAWLFARMHHQTGSAPMRDAAVFWLHDTLARGHREDAYAGFRADLRDDLEHADLQVSLLNGIAGIGLALMALTSAIEPAWDRALLLS